MIKTVTMLIAAFLLGSGAFAESQTDSVSFSLQPAGTRILELDMFKGNIDELESVVFNIMYTKTGGSAQADNDSKDSGFITFTHRINANLTSADVHLLDASSAIIGANMNASSSSEQIYLAPSSNDDMQTFTTSQNNDFYTWEPDDVSFKDNWDLNSLYYSDIVGTGTYNINFEAIQNLSVTGFGGISQAFTPSDVNGTLSVTYNYIPEPTSAALIGVVGLAALLIRRRFGA